MTCKRATAALAKVVLWRVLRAVPAKHAIEQPEDSRSGPGYRSQILERGRLRFDLEWLVRYDSWCRYN